MTERFAGEFTLTKSEGEIQVEAEDVIGSWRTAGDDYSNLYGISDEIEKRDDVKKLPDGEYFLYVEGSAGFVSDVDWESGTEEGSFSFDIEKIVIVEVKDERDPQQELDVCPICKEDIEIYHEKRQENFEPPTHLSCYIKELKYAIARAKTVVDAIRSPDTLDINEAVRQFEASVGFEEDKGGW